MSVLPDRNERTGAVNSPAQPSARPPEASSRFRDRHDAGRRLAPLLERFERERPIVVGIPRGGVPVAAEVARALKAPLDIVVARKVGAPMNPEYGIGAVAEGGARVISGEAVRRLEIGSQELDALVAQTERELAALTERLRARRPRLAVSGRTVILVDDGLATGRTARAAALSMRLHGAARVILAVPVAAPSSVADLRDSVEEVICEQMPPDLWAIGFWYEDFQPTSEQEVGELLDELAPQEPVATGGTSPGQGTSPVEGISLAEERDASRSVAIRIDAGPGVSLPGDLTLPSRAASIVAFAHGSGSSRLSTRNRAVAAALNDAGLGTLLFDLLTPGEEADRANVFDVPLLAQRLIAATRDLSVLPDTHGLALGYFGASTGAAAALAAAAEAGRSVGAVVSRGGRPDLAMDVLGEVLAPTLLIVGGEDRQVLELNRLAQARLRCPNRLAVVPGASHLFEEPGALEQVARLASDWFATHLSRGRPPAG